jgi:endonuclease III
MFAGDLEDCRSAFVYLAHHGEVTCTKADPLCGVCPVHDDCPEGQARLNKRGGIS